MQAVFIYPIYNLLLQYTALWKCLPLTIQHVMSITLSSNIQHPTKKVTEGTTIDYNIYYDIMYQQVTEISNLRPSGQELLLSAAVQLFFFSKCLMRIYEVCQQDSGKLLKYDQRTQRELSKDHKSEPVRKPSQNSTPSSCIHSRTMLFQHTSSQTDDICSSIRAEYIFVRQNILYMIRFKEYQIRVQTIIKLRIVYGDNLLQLPALKMQLLFGLRALIDHSFIS